MIGARYSVGVVGLKGALSEIARLRAALDPDVYLWINAYKRDPDYYSEADIAAFEAIDPLFRTNTVRHRSLGASCRAGATSFTVDGQGDVRRCHFIREPIGNLYGAGIEAALAERACTNATCGCHIGYVHLDRLNLYETYADGLLERIPARYSATAV